MADIILHQYATSPFSEKVRLLLGAKGLAWQAVEIPAILPKPDLLSLTGGYRIGFVAFAVFCAGAALALLRQREARR